MIVSKAVKKTNSKQTDIKKPKETSRSKDCEDSKVNQPEPQLIENHTPIKLNGKPKEFKKQANPKKYPTKELNKIELTRKA